MLIYEAFKNNLEILIAEFFMTLMILILLLFGIFLKKKVYKNTNKINILIINEMIIYLLLITLLLLYNKPIPSLTTLNSFFLNNEFSNFIHIILTTTVILYIIFSKKFLLFNNIIKYENSILILISSLGLLLLVSSYNFITLYLSIELQSLCFYILTVSNTKSPISSEASLKYFILGAIASGFILYGSSIIYFSTGSLNFSNIFNILININSINNFQLIVFIFYGFTLILIGLLFKIGVAPFHSWLPDVYEGAPNNVTAFFAIIPKIALISLLIKLLFDIFTDLSEFFESILYICSLLSIVTGSFISLQQKKIKRLLAYSSISHVGFILIGFVSNSFQDIQNILLYIIIYIVMNINIWTIFLSITKKKKSIKLLIDLTNHLKINPVLTILLMLTLFSMAGIPPLAGFFSKMYIFYAALQNSLTSLAIIGIILSVISTFYYIRLIKIAYFDKKDNFPLFDNISKNEAIIISLSSHFIIYFFFFFNYLLLYLKKLTLLFLL